MHSTSRMPQSVSLQGESRTVLDLPCNVSALCCLTVALWNARAACLHMEMSTGECTLAACAQEVRCCRLTRERDEARAAMESAVAAARAAGPVPNGATAMEEDEPPSKRVRIAH